MPFQRWGWRAVSKLERMVGTTALAVLSILVPVLAEVIILLSLSGSP